MITPEEILQLHSQGLESFQLIEGNYWNFEKKIKNIAEEIPH